LVLAADALLSALGANEEPALGRPDGGAALQRSRWLALLEQPAHEAGGVRVQIRTVSQVRALARIMGSCSLPPSANTPQGVWACVCMFRARTRADSQRLAHR
jgi:hypothetical protein